MKKVAVLVSTYNGEKYIASQIDSIINQTYKNIDIYVRDDLSCDTTLKILKQYKKKKKIFLVKSYNHLGYPESFYALMKQIKSYDYYSFCDQDDVWEIDKIEIAVNYLNRSSAAVPTLFFSNYEVTDANLKHIRTSIGPNKKLDFRYSLFSSLGLGFTYVFNDTTRKLILDNRSIKNITKDVWIGMLVSAFGVVYFDKRSCAKHRRNSGSYSSLDTTFISIQKDRFRKFFKDNGFQSIRDIMEEFYMMFYNTLKNTDRKKMELFLYGNRFQKFFYPYRLRYDLRDELMLRIIFLLGKL